MACWLVKTEPSEYSFGDLVRDGKTSWDGVTNPTAVKHLATMVAGDEVVLYHTGNEKRAVGLATVSAVAAGKVTLAAGAALAKPVPLAKLKAAKEFADSPLVKIGRLSVVPLTAAQWKKLLGLAK